jgi:hypothetical protein
MHLYTHYFVEASLKDACDISVCFDLYTAAFYSAY